MRLLLIKNLQGSLHDMVLLVDDGEILVHIPQVAGDECFQLRAQHGKRLLQLFIILWFHILLLGLSDYFVDHLLRHVEARTEILKRSILLAEPARKSSNEAYCLLSWRRFLSMYFRLVLMMTPFAAS